MAKVRQFGEKRMREATGAFAVKNAEVKKRRARGNQGTIDRQPERI